MSIAESESTFLTSGCQVLAYLSVGDGAVISKSTPKLVTETVPATRAQAEGTTLSPTPAVTEVPEELTTIVESRLQEGIGQQKDIGQQKEIGQLKEIGQQKDIGQQKEIVQVKEIGQQKEFGQEKEIGQQKELVQEKEIGQQKELVQEKEIGQEKEFGQQKEIGQQKEAVGGNERTDTANLSEYDPKTSTFSCLNRQYGYHADLATKCSVFHLCYPVVAPLFGEVTVQQLTFVCPNGSVFDQQEHVCAEVDPLRQSCSESHNYYTESNNNLIESVQQNVQTYGQSSEQAAAGSGVPAAGEAVVAEPETAEASEIATNITSAAETTPQYSLLQRIFG